MSETEQALTLEGRYDLGEEAVDWTVLALVGIKARCWDVSIEEAWETIDERDFDEELEELAKTRLPNSIVCNGVRLRLGLSDDAEVELISDRGPGGWIRVTEWEDVRIDNHVVHVVGCRYHCGVFLCGPSHVEEHCARTIDEEAVFSHIETSIPEAIDGARREAEAWLRKWEEWIEDCRGVSR